MTKTPDDPKVIHLSVTKRPKAAQPKIPRVKKSKIAVKDKLEAYYNIYLYTEFEDPDGDKALARMAQLVMGLSDKDPDKMRFIMNIARAFKGLDAGQDNQALMNPLLDRLAQEARETPDKAYRLELCKTLTASPFLAADAKKTVIKTMFDLLAE